MEIKVDNYYWYDRSLLKITFFHEGWYYYEAFLGYLFTEESPKDQSFHETSNMATLLKPATEADRILYGA